MNTQSIQAIKHFMSDKRIRDAQAYVAQVTAFSEEEQIAEEKTDVRFSYNISYMQYEVSIDWPFSDKTMKKLDLHRGYNTNYQTFCYDDTMLKIESDDITIIIE